jgi:ABC-type Mn2+/Zn2+ transport system ATPase subunit
MAIGDVVLAVHSLDLAYGRKTVLEKVDMEVRTGEFWFFLGPNGEGKTTLLRAILGELPPRSGQVLFGEEFGRRECLAFIPQHCDLNPTLPTTVREFVSLGFVGIGINREERAVRLSRALERVGLKGAARQEYWTLSGGQRQRVLVARALVRQPRLLILDEPTKGLDLPTEESFLQLLSGLNRQEQLTILFVAHDLDLAARFGSHVALFSNGRVQVGPSREVLNSASLALAYGMPIVVRREPSGAMTIHIDGEV